MWKPLSKTYSKAFLKAFLKNFLKGGLVLGALLLFSGCDVAVLNPKGTIAEQQKDLIYTSVKLMLIVVIPVLMLTVFFAFKFRESNKKADYQPDWDHNTKLEVIWWGIPIVIIIILGYITWVSSHDLDPYKPLEGEHMDIEVVALDWKWLFIYPEQNVAAVNDLRLPVDKPVRFKISAQAPMNSFWIPHLAGQIYAMEGMQTLLHVKGTEIGKYPGLSSNFSGRGYNDMKFVTTVASEKDFNAWIDSIKATPKALSKPVYDKLAKPSEKHPIEVFSSVEKNLFLNIMGAYMGMQKKNGHDGHHEHKKHSGHDHSEHHGKDSSECCGTCGLNKKPGAADSSKADSTKKEMKMDEHSGHGGHSGHGDHSGHDDHGSHQGHNH